MLSRIRRHDDAEPKWARRRTVEAAMVKVRWWGTAFALFQVLTFYRPYPRGVRASALALVAVLALGNIVIWFLHRRLYDPKAIARLSLAALGFDCFVLLAFVVIYTFDEDTAIWALLFVLPLEGALRFQRRGALGVMTVAAVGYVARELYGSTAYGHDFLPTSITFRMGIGFIIAVVAGVMSERLVQERDHVRSLYEATRALARSLDREQVIEALTRSAREQLDATSAAVYVLDGDGPILVASDPQKDENGDSSEAGELESQAIQRCLAEDRLVSHAGADDRARFVAVPLKEDERRASVLLVCWTGPHRMGIQDEDSIRQLAETASVALSHAAAYGQERATASELRRLQEIRARFLGMVAHDLRTPLTVLKGAAELMQTAKTAPEQQQQLLSAVDRQLEFLSRLVQDLLEVARIEAGRLEISPVPTQVAEAVVEAVADIPGAFDLETDIPDELWVMADRHRLKQIVMNLLSNAYRHGAPPVRFGAQAREGDVVLEVSDRGSGLSAERREQAFEAFRAGEVPGSVGLGLTIVRGLVEAHGGTVEYQANEPEGARFSVTLPRALRPEQPLLDRVGNS